MDSLTPLDRAWLERAREIARGGWGRVHPNPMVGCVLVRDGEVVGEGFHEAFGGPHAEIVALEVARTSAEGATAYVSLEPCNHHGQTPPCSEALIQAGVRRVVYGASEPGQSEGGGAARLAAQGIQVEGPVWSAREGRAENPAFHHTRSDGTPFVALKLAMTLDARIAEEEGSRTRITGTEAEREVHRLRTGHDAVMIGAGTGRVDDPRLTIRYVPEGHRPLRRLLLDPRAELPTDALLFEDVDAAPLHIFTWLDASEEEMERLEAAGAHVHPVSGTESRLDLEHVLQVCWDLGIHSILAEGGSTLAASLLEGGHVQRLYVFIAPRTLGDRGVRAFAAPEAGLIPEGFEPAGPAITCGIDTLLTLDRGPV